MSSVAGIFDAAFEWKKEIVVDVDGKGWLSRRAIARLAGVHHSAIARCLASIAEEGGAENEERNTETVIEYGFEGGALPYTLQAFSGQSYNSASKIPDVLATALITHFALTAKNKSKQAARVLAFLAGRSLREYCQEVVGWVNSLAITPASDSSLAAIHQLLLIQQEQTAFLVQESKRTQAEMVLLAEKQIKFHNAGNSHPGSKAIILNELDEEEPYDGGMTIPQWLASQGIDLPSTARNAMSRRAAQFYRVDKMVDPQKLGNNVVFYGKDLVYIELAYRSVTGSY